MNKYSNFYATDRDLFEALTSKKKKFTKDLLLELCLDRGIVVSESITREELIDYLSSLPHDYNDFKYLSELIVANSKSEKITYDDVPKEVSNDDIKKTVKKLESKRSKLGEQYTVVVEGDNKTVIKVNYTEMDYSLTRLRQRKPKEAFIEVTKNNGVTKIRRPANDRVNKIVDEIFTEVKDDEGVIIEKENISLSHITDSHLRTQFFTDLINDLDGLNLDDVIYIKVDNLLSQADSDESDEESSTDEAAQQILGYVKKAALDGEGLLYSNQYQHLSDSGFYISTIVWQSIEDKTDGNKIEFEASFGDSKNCNDFKYNVRGFYKCNEGNFTVSKRPFQDHDKTKYFNLIESRAKEVLELLSGDSDKEE